MKPLFTVHAGEFVVGNHIEANFKNVKVWIPAKDTGIDLLVTDKRNKKAVSLQVKFSRDYLVTHLPPEFRKSLQACGWFLFNRHKIKDSPADYWVFVLTGSNKRGFDYVITAPDTLLKRLDAIHGKQERIDSYLWVTKDGGCWETRGLKRADQSLIVESKFIKTDRDFSEHLNNWDPIENLNQ